MMTVDLRLGDCLEVMRTIASTCIDAVIADPPYGCGKAEWDDSFPVSWYRQAKRIARTIVIITGSEGLRDSVPLVGDDYIDTIAARNLNGMTRSAIGFGNWLAAVVACGHIKQGVTFFEFAVNGDKPNHPSPKPLPYMLKLIERVTNPGDTILDPFMGSGTTGVACILTGRNFVGIEIRPDYFLDAQRRIAEAQLQPRLLDYADEQPQQLSLT